MTSPVTGKINEKNTSKEQTTKEVADTIRNLPLEAQMDIWHVQTCYSVNDIHFSV